MSPRQHHLRAILYALIGATLWVVGDASMKLASGLGTPKQEIMVISGFSGMAAVYLTATLRGESGKLRLKEPRGMLILCLCSVTCLVCWLISLPRMPMADYYTIIFLMPMVVAGFAALFLGEPLGWKKALAILAGFIGVIIAVNPAGVSAARNPVGYLAVFIGMMVLSAQMMLIRVMGAYESREAIAFYPRIAATIAGIAACTLWGLGPLPVRSLIYCLAYGACAGTGWLFMAQAYKHAPAATVAPFQYSQIITGGVIGYLVWQDVPTPHLVLGAVIIIAAGLYIAAHGPKAEAEAASNPLPS